MILSTDRVRDKFHALKQNRFVLVLSQANAQNLATRNCKANEKAVDFLTGRGHVEFLVGPNICHKRTSKR